jgi:hypothetical protein
MAEKKGKKRKALSPEEIEENKRLKLEERKARQLVTKEQRKFDKHQDKLYNPFHLGSVTTIYAQLGHDFYHQLLLGDIWSIVGEFVEAKPGDLLLVNESNSHLALLCATSHWTNKFRLRNHLFEMRATFENVFPWSSLLNMTPQEIDIELNKWKAFCRKPKETWSKTVELNSDKPERKFSKRVQKMMKICSNRKRPLPPLQWLTEGDYQKYVVYDPSVHPKLLGIEQCPK